VVIARCLGLKSSGNPWKTGDNTLYILHRSHGIDRLMPYFSAPEMKELISQMKTQLIAVDKCYAIRQRCCLVFNFANFPCISHPLLLLPGVFRRVLLGVAV
jgi:hypothetical protein